MELKIANRTLRYLTPQVMGIINITPDSYYSKSRHVTPKEVFIAMDQMLKEGAGMIDIGAVSSRPGAAPLPATLEWERLSPVLGALRRHFPETLISIDTTCSKVVEQAYDLIGSFIVNDISAGEGDRGMFSVSARLQLPLITMHMRGTPQTMQQQTHYSDVIEEVHRYFASVCERAQEAGVQQIILDPGFGFAKTTAQNYELLAALHKLFNFPNVLRMIGISRKSMIYEPLGISIHEALSATSALHLFALKQGVDILRVHDVAEAVRMVRLHAMF
jgi:dihydropteroate synthase